MAAMSPAFSTNQNRIYLLAVFTPVAGGTWVCGAGGGGGGG